MNEKTKAEVKMYMANDWDIKEETPDYVLLQRNTATGTGHLLVFLIVGWWTLGLANLIYWATCKKKKKIMK